jgi:hypothetical protein
MTLGQSPPPTAMRRGVLAFVILCLAGCGASPDQEARTPDGTVTLNMVQAAFIGSGTGGTGTLVFQGKSYPFTIGGLGVGGVGASSVSAEGEVYGLTDIAQFPGTYGRARAGFALGTLSGGQLWLQNGNGVTMRLQAARTGLMLSLGADAMIVTLDR